MKPWVRNTVVTLLVILFVATGFFREFLFVNVNEQRRVAYYQSGDSQVAPSMQWLTAFDDTTLYYAKWPLTLLFTAIFAGLTALIMRIAFDDKRLVRVTWLVYGGVFAIAFLIYAAGWLTGNSESTYEISRFVVGIAETPALLVVLFATFLALRKL
jgi:hypothetical protein